MSTLIDHSDIVQVDDLAELARECLEADQDHQLTAEQRNTQDALMAFLSDLGIRYPSGHGGSWQEWLVDELEDLGRNGDPLIAENHWPAYVEDLAADTAPEPGGLFGVIDERYRDAWPYRWVAIDWEAAADELRSDYNEPDLDGRPYLIRAS